MTKINKKIFVIALAFILSISAFMGVTLMNNSRAYADGAIVTVDTTAGVVKPGRVIANFVADGPFEQSPNLAPATSVNGDNEMGGGTTFGSANYSWTALFSSDAKLSHIKGTPENDRVIYHVFNGWGWTLSRILSFTEPVDRNEIDGITLRIGAHLSNSDTYGIIGENPPHGGTGIYFFAPDSDGSEGVLLPYDIKQDEWTDFTITGEELDKLVDANGKISGFWIGMGCIAEVGQVLHSFTGTSIDQAAHIVIDSVKYNDKQEVVYKDGEQVIKTAEVYTGKVPFYVPEKDGSVFLGWSVNQASGRLLGIQEEYSLDITTLYANWTDAGDLTDVKGIYNTADSKKIMIFNDGTVRFDDAFGEVLYYAYGSNGVLYAYTKDARLAITLSSLTKIDSIEVAYMDGEFGDQLFYKTRIAKGSIPQNIENTANTFEFWSSQLNGRKYAFTQSLDEDIVLYAVNRFDGNNGKVITGNNDFTMGPDWTLQSIAGTTAMNDGTAVMQNGTFNFHFNIANRDVSKEEKWNGSDDGKAFSMLIGPWGFSHGKPVLFKNPVKVENYDSVTFRIYAHLSPKSPYGGELWGGCGIRIFGAHSDGSDSGVLIPLDIKQDQWVDLTVGKDLLNVLADEDGYMYGFNIGAAIVVDTSVAMGKDRWHTHFDWNSQNIHQSTYVMIDYITLSSDKTLTYTDSDGSVLETQTFMGGQYVEKNFVPEKDGKVFTGWTAYEKPLDYSEIFYQSVNLYANYVNAANIINAKGIYTKSNEEIRIFKDGSVEIVGLDNAISSGLGTDGILYVACTDGVKTYDLSTYTKTTIREITVDLGEGVTEKYAIKDGETFNAEFTKVGYLVDKIVKKGTTTEFVLGTDVVSSDLELEVVWAYDEVDDYTAFIGNYYNETDKIMLELKADNVAVYDGENYTYYVLNSDEIVIEGVGQATYGGTYISMNGNFIRLGAFVVNFYTGRGNAKIDPVIYDQDNYVISRPTDPVREGYRFVCWLTAGGEVFDFSTVVTGSIHLFAKWEVDPNYSVEEPPILNGDVDETSGGGCGGSLTATTSIALCAYAVAGAMILNKKRRNNK